MILSSIQIEAFKQDGFVVIEAGIPRPVLDGVVWDLEQADPATKAQYQAGRIQDAWKRSEHIKNVATFPSVLKALEQLYGFAPLPFQTLNFPRGTEQRAHADSIHFNSEPFGMMCGVWVALEDIGEKQGPLVYYPGSHRLPEMNFPELGISPISYDNYSAYEDAIERKIEEHGFKPSYGLLKKGQALIWAANLFHGGSKQADKTLSRLSQVTHYYFPQCRYWRPGFSTRVRHYFEPDWIPYEGLRIRANKLRRLVYRVRNSLN